MTAALLEFHWWCAERARRHGRAGNVIRTLAFDWVGQCAADLFCTLRGM